MKVALGHLGYVTYALKASLEALDVEVLLSPPNSELMHRISQGYMHPELCYPLKLLLGNYLYHIESRPDAVIFYSGCDLCNLSPINYCYNNIFNDMGWYPETYFCEINSKKRFIMSYLNIIKKISNRSWLDLGKSIALGMSKFEAFNKLDQVFYSKRPVFMGNIDVEAIYNSFFNSLIVANNTKKIRNISDDLLKLHNSYANYPYDDMLMIGLVGDTFTLSEPFIHQYVDRQLGHMGVVVDRWSEHKFLPEKSLKNRRLPESKQEKLDKIFQNNYGVFTSLELLKLYRYIARGYDGILFLSPLECNPNDALRNLLSKVQSDLDFPILSLVFDEHTSPTGVIVRLEAFVDLLNKRKNLKTTAITSL